MTRRPSISARTTDALRSLSVQRWSLFALLLFLNALARPYQNLDHDSRLYAVQVMNRVHDGAYNDDLFFRYGTQDRYSVFSLVVAPVVSLVGLKTAFFAFYLLVNALFIFALQRFVETLVKDRLLSTLGLIFAVTAPLTFSGLTTLHIHEQFLTPRPIAIALVLLGLDRALRGRWLMAFVLQFLALMAHPLMALAGFLTTSAFFAVERLNPRLLIAAAGICFAVGTTVILYQPLGQAVFGHMDAEWSSYIRHASYFNFPSEWATRDWLNVIVSTSVTLAAAGFMWREERRYARFLLVAVGACLLGLLGTLVGSTWSYTLLFQAQPHRMLWLIKLLQTALIFWVAARLWQMETIAGAVLAGVTLIATFVVDWMLPEFQLMGLALPFALIALRMKGDSSKKDWLGKAVLISAIFGSVAWVFYKFFVYLALRDQLLGVQMDSFDYASAFWRNVSPVIWLLLGILIVFVGACRTRFGRGFQIGCLCLAFAIQFAVFYVPNSDFCKQHHLYAEDVDFLEEFLQANWQSNERPTIYSSLALPHVLWVDLESKIYFDRFQVGVFLFFRETAVEGHRRAGIVAPFEMDCLNKKQVMLPKQKEDHLTTFYQRSLSAPPPTRDDLHRVCREKGVDYVVIKQGFPGLYEATNGELYIYDCKKVRAAMRQSEETDSMAMTSSPES